MKNNSVFNTFIERLRSNKRLETGVIAGLLILSLVIFLLSGVISCDRTENTKTEADDVGRQDMTEMELERRLEAILSDIDGAGKVRVMITYETGLEIVPAEESQTSSSQTGSTQSRRPAAVTGGGKESPIVLTEIMPKIRGVIVVAQGAGNIKVRQELLDAVRTVLGTDISKISVFSMEG